MTKADLKTGMFGRTNMHQWFVVVYDKLVYEDGGYDRIEDMDDNLSFDVGWCIDFLVYADSFEHAKTIDYKSKRCLMHRNTPVKFRSKSEVEFELGYSFVIEEDEHDAE